MQHKQIARLAGYKVWCNSDWLLYIEIVVSSFFKTLLPFARDVTLSLNECTDWQTSLHDIATFVTHTLWPSTFSNTGKKGRRHVTDYARDNCNSRHAFRRFLKHSNNSPLGSSCQLRISWQMFSILISGLIDEVWEVAQHLVASFLH